MNLSPSTHIYKLAQVGLGRWGKVLASVADKHPGFSLDWIHTRSPIEDERFRDRYESDFPKILEANPDGIILATPLEGRETWIEKIIKSKIPLLVEKPLASNLQIAKNLTQLAEYSLVPVIVNYVHSYSPTIQWLLDEGIPQLGEIRAVRITMGQPGGRYREEGVETLLLSHLIYIVYKLFPQISTHGDFSKNWEKIFSTTDHHGKSVAIELRNQATQPTISLFADLSYPSKSRLIEITGEKGSIQAEYGGEGNIAMSLWEKETANSRLTQTSLDQSNNLGRVLTEFHDSISAYKTGQINNSESYKDFSNTKIACAIDTILGKIN